jgi:hypothetical protein
MNSRPRYTGNFDTLAGALAAITAAYPGAEHIRCYEHSVDNDFPSSWPRSCEAGKNGCPAPNSILGSCERRSLVCPRQPSVAQTLPAPAAPLKPQPILPVTHRRIMRRRACFAPIGGRNFAYSRQRAMGGNIEGDLLLFSARVELAIAERCRSGRTGRSRKPTAASSHGARGPAGLRTTLRAARNPTSPTTREAIN